MNNSLSDLLVAVEKAFEEIPLDPEAIAPALTVVESVVKDVSHFSAEQGKLHATGLILGLQSELLQSIATDVGRLGSKARDDNLVAIAVATEACARSIRLWGTALNKLSVTAAITQGFAMDEDGSLKDNISFHDLGNEVLTRIQEHIDLLAAEDNGAPN